METIRKASLEDAETLSAISRATFGGAFRDLYPPMDLEVFLAETYAVEQSRRALANPDASVWLYQADEAVVGYALAGPCELPNAEVTPACGELKRLYLLSGWQGGGRGSRLIATALDWLLRRGPRRIWLGVYSENFAAQRLYARHGFRKVGEHTFRVGRTIDHEFTFRRD